MNPTAVVIHSFIEANSSMIRAIKRVFLVQVFAFLCSTIMRMASPAGHILSNVNTSRRVAKKLISEVFKPTRLANNWSAFQQRHQQNVCNHKRV